MSTVISGKEINEETKAYIGRLYKSFAFFLTELWKAIGTPAPPWHQLDMADYLQYGPKHRILIAFRGATKTWVTVAYDLWRLFRDRSQGVLLVSKTEGHAKDSLFMARNWVATVPFLKHMEPE